MAAEAKSAIDTPNINNTTNTLILTLLIDFNIYAINNNINILFHPFGTLMKLKYGVQFMPESVDEYRIAGYLCLKWVNLFR